MNYFIFWVKYWSGYFFNNEVKTLTKSAHEYQTFKYSNLGRPNCEPLITIEAPYALAIRRNPKSK